MYPIVAKRLVYIGSPPARNNGLVPSIKKIKTQVHKYKHISNNIHNSTLAIHTVHPHIVYTSVFTSLIIYQPIPKIILEGVE